MRKTTYRSLTVAALITAGAPLFAASCESLSMLSFPDATITSSQSVGAGEFSAPATGKGKGGGNPFAGLPTF